MNNPNKEQSMNNPNQNQQNRGGQQGGQGGGQQGGQQKPGQQQQIRVSPVSRAVSKSRISRTRSANSGWFDLPGSAPAGDFLCSGVAGATHSNCAAGQPSNCCKPW